MTPQQLSALKRWAYIATIGMYIVVVMGSLVTNTESGEGCGRSWPLCHGAPVPLPTVESMIEFSHRAVSGLVALAVFITAYLAYRRLRQRPEALWLSAIAAVFLLIEAGLGAATVLWPEPPEILALHMGVSLLSFAGVFLLSVFIVQIQTSGTHRQQTPHDDFIKMVWFTALATVVVIYLGAYVRHAAPGVSCQGWPLCNGAVLPELAGSVGIQFVHRLAAGMYMLLVLGLYGKARRYRPLRPDLYRGALFTLIFAALQNLSGAVVVFNGAQLPSIMLHSALLPPVFASISYLCMQVLPEAQPLRAKAHDPAAIRSRAARYTS